MDVGVLLGVDVRVGVAVLDGVGVFDAVTVMEGVCEGISVLVDEEVRVKVWKCIVRVGVRLGVPVEVEVGRGVPEGGRVTGGRGVRVSAGRVGVLPPGVMKAKENGVRISCLTGSMMPTWV